MLESALTHASGADHRLESNERLEFLGDAILGAVVCELLFEKYPQYLEGDLTKIKSVVVSRQTCAKISEAIGMQEFLILGKGMTTDPQVPMSVLADVFESLIAGIYLDGGHEAARKFIVRHLEPEIELVASGDTGGNYKSILQQLAQREHEMGVQVPHCFHPKMPSQSALREGPRESWRGSSRPGPAAGKQYPGGTSVSKSCAYDDSDSAEAFGVARGWVYQR